MGCPDTITVDNLVYYFSAEVDFTPCSSVLDQCRYTNYGFCYCMDIKDGSFLPRRLDVNSCPNEQGIRETNSRGPLANFSSSDLRDLSSPLSRDLSGYNSTFVGYVPREDWDDQNLKDIKISKIVMYEQAIFNGKSDLVFNVLKVKSQNLNLSILFNSYLFLALFWGLTLSQF